jgi:hypothetical protein
MRRDDVPYDRGPLLASSLDRETTGPRFWCGAREFARSEVLQKNGIDVRRGVSESQSVPSCRFGTRTNGRAMRCLRTRASSIAATTGADT